MSDSCIDLGNSLWHLPNGHKDGDDVWEPGYYFVDEASQFNGPFETAVEADRALTAYCREFLGVKQ